MKLVIGNYTYSSWSMRPWVFINYHKIPVEVERHCFFTPEMQAAMDKRFSNGKVPILEDDGVEIWDSLSILEYLGDKYPEIQAWPESPGARAIARSVSAEMHSSFQAVRNEMPMNCKKRFPGYPLSDDCYKDISRIQNLWSYCRNNFASDGNWLFGDYSIADAMYAPVVMRFRSFDLELDQNAQQYCEQVLNHESTQAWLQNAHLETEVVEEDELDWPGIQIPLD